MALKQSRRSVSLSRKMHSASAAVAAVQGVTHSHFVEQALIAFGVACETGVHMTRADAATAMRNREPRVLSRDEPRPVRSPRVWDKLRGGGELRAVETGTPEYTAPDLAEPAPAATSSRRTHTAVAYHTSQVASP